MSSDQRINMVAQTDDGLEPIAKKAANYVAGLIAAPGVIRLTRGSMESQAVFLHLADLSYTEVHYLSKFYEVRGYFSVGTMEVESYKVVVSENHEFANSTAIELMFQAQLERQSLRGRE